MLALKVQHVKVAARLQAAKPGTAYTLNTTVVLLWCACLPAVTIDARQATGAPDSLSQNGYGSPWFCNGRFTA